MTFDEWKEDYGLVHEPYYGTGREADCLAAFKAGAASRDAEVARLIELCHDCSAQQETDALIIKADRNEIHFLREQRDEWKSRTEFSFGVRDRLEQERDQLHEQVAMLRIALFVIQDNSDDIGVIERALEALEKTEPK